MKSRSLTAQILRIFIRINLTVLVIVGIVALIGWVAGWQTQDAFQSAIQVAGLLAIGIGLMGLKSARDKTRNVEVQDSMSKTSQDSWRKNQQNLSDFSHSYSFLLVMFFSGGICLLIGWLM